MEFEQIIRIIEAVSNSSLTSFQYEAANGEKINIDRAAGAAAPVGTGRAAAGTEAAMAGITAQAAGTAGIPAAGLAGAAVQAQTAGTAGIAPAAGLAGTAVQTAGVAGVTPAAGLAGAAAQAGMAPVSGLAGTAQAAVGTTSAAALTGAASAGAAVQAAAVQGTGVAAEGAAAAGESLKEGNVVESPLVGTFYAAPAEDAEPFVKVGDHVKKGQTLGIVEAMKLMNEIESDYDGVVTAILVQNGDTVEYGMPLFCIA